MDRGTAGWITTHDLTLVEIAEVVGSGAANFRFEDRLDDGNQFFDYRLSRGIARTGNASIHRHQSVI